MTTESQPLLGEGGVLDDYHDYIVHPKDLDQESSVRKPRRQVRSFLASKWGHYLVFFLVSLDVSCIFADFLLSLYICEHTCRIEETVNPALPKTQNALAVVSLVFSCLFMVELLASLWAFGAQ